MPRKQLNVTLTPEQYEAVQEAAAEEGVKVADLLPERHPGPGRCLSRRSLTGPRSRPGLLHFLLFVTRGKSKAV